MTESGESWQESPCCDWGIYLPTSTSLYDAQYSRTALAQRAVGRSAKIRVVAGLTEETVKSVRQTVDHGDGGGDGQSR